eukprot:TRINITY_DN1970_c0_g1_i4.p1 TRINITY_DN1970_c0_g1~~TRINITY_DN1970_c0_g1_i4.p1  ORF type:complete len:417 (-),score=79.60 TRINITY_DN1970_c0_g1_i4:152-1402(-)
MCTNGSSNLWLGTLWCLGHLIMQDRDLSVYSPDASSTSKHLTCESNLCQLHRHCKTNTQPCPYVVQYQSNNTSTSGSLVEDFIYLASGRELASGRSVRTRVVIGCGRIQSGGFLNGGAPDGLLGLGLSDISVPSLLAKAGLVQNSFSMCFQPDDSGRIFFGDKGKTDQQTTPFLSLNGTRPTYIVGIEAIHVGSVSINISAFKSVIDSGTSFTYLPQDAYKALVKEFNKQVNYPRAHYKELPWAYCYEARSSDNYGYPEVSLIFKGGSNFSVYNPIIGIYTENGTMEAFCLALQEGSIDNLGIIGQNFMTSYRMVFDRETLKLGWSPSDCYLIEEQKGNATSPSPSPDEGIYNEAPFQQQQTSPAHAVAPAMAGRAPPIDKSNTVHTDANVFTSMIATVSLMMILLKGLRHNIFCW